MAPRPEYKPGLLPVGRPSKDVMKQRYQMQGMFFDKEIVSDEELAQIIRRAKTDAIEGNAQARDFIAAYVWGRPKPMDEGGITINVAGDDTKLALLTREQLELLVSITEAPPAIEDVDTPNADRVIDAEYRTLPG